MKRFFNITLPIVKYPELESQLLKHDAFPYPNNFLPNDHMFVVGQAASKQHRRAVETLATYFRREFDYDFLQYSSNEHVTDTEAMAFLWTIPDGIEDGKYHAFGACCFRWRKWEVLPSAWGLQWVWMHPYKRNSGVLTKSWPIFTKLFAPFDVERPLSRSMNSFLSNKPHVIRVSNNHDVPFFV